ncbi:hypothetical protein R1flu_011862 [Riccia fluitans]|uniref:Uncharacterized protein n=1 Tax=Riccia fluitans TaxID=41844 RepID=A0ABD1Z979_9MARC
MELLAGVPAELQADSGRRLGRQVTRDHVSRSPSSSASQASSPLPPSPPPALAPEQRETDQDIAQYAAKSVMLEVLAMKMHLGSAHRHRYFVTTLGVVLTSMFLHLALEACQTALEAELERLQKEVEDRQSKVEEAVVELATLLK